jgi:hypothetical protein
MPLAAAWSSSSALMDSVLWRIASSAACVSKVVTFPVNPLLKPLSFWMMALSASGYGFSRGSSRPKLTTNSRNSGLSRHFGKEKGSNREAIWGSVCIAYSASLESMTDPQARR